MLPGCPLSLSVPNGCVVAPLPLVPLPQFRRGVQLQGGARPPEPVPLTQSDLPSIPFRCHTVCKGKKLGDKPRERMAGRTVPVVPPKTPQVGVVSSSCTHPVAQKEWSDEQFRRWWLRSRDCGWTCTSRAVRPNLFIKDSLRQRAPQAKKQYIVRRGRGPRESLPKLDFVLLSHRDCGFAVPGNSRRRRPCEFRQVWPRRRRRPHYGVVVGQVEVVEIYDERRWWCWTWCCWRHSRWWWRGI